MWDIFFISYKESNCESNWRRLKELHKNAKRIHGITGIDRAHLTVNGLADTQYFWVIDGDNYLLRPLEWQIKPRVDLTMFHAVDPLTDITTALGAPKLWRKNSFINHDMSKGDFTLFSVAHKEVIQEHFSINLYNATPFETWKTSFRHCVKLLSCILQSRDPKYATNINRYIETWKSTKYSNRPNASWAYQGFLDAENYVKIYDNNIQELNKINDFKWLNEQWDTKNAA